MRFTNERKFKQGDIVYLVKNRHDAWKRGNTPSVQKMIVVEAPVINWDHGVASAPTVGFLRDGSEVYHLLPEDGSTTIFNDYPSSRIYKTERGARAFLVKEVQEERQAAMELEAQKKADLAELTERLNLMASWLAVWEPEEEPQQEIELPDGMRYLEERRDLARCDHGCDYGTERHVIIQNGGLVLLRVPGHSYWSGVGSTSYAPTEYILHDRGGDNMHGRHKEIELFEGRASKKKWKEHIETIREFFGDERITVEMIDTTKTLNIEGKEG